MTTNSTATGIMEQMLWDQHYGITDPVRKTKQALTIRCRLGGHNAEPQAVVHVSAGDDAEPRRTIGDIMRERGEDMLDDDDDDDWDPNWSDPDLND